MKKSLEELEKEYEGRLLKYLVNGVEVYMELKSANRLAHNIHLSVWCQE